MRYCVRYPTRRSIYAYVDRQNLPGTFRSFDFASPEQHTAQRFVTTVPQQALYLMNNPFVLEQARATVERRDVLLNFSTKRRIDTLYEIVLGRKPTNTERLLCLEYLEKSTKTIGRTEAWQLLTQTLIQSNEFSFID